FRIVDMPLPFDVFCVYRDPQHFAGWLDPHAPDPPSPDACLPGLARIQRASMNWTIQLYLALRRRGHRAHLVDRLVPGELCIMHYDHHSMRDDVAHSFLVVIQPDRPRVPMADVRIVQNHRCIRNPETDLFMPMWPQPGLQPRDPARGDT